MRTALFLACLAAGVACEAPAFAQSPLDGPLVSPDAPAAKSQPPAKHAKAKPKKARHAAAGPIVAPPTRAVPADERRRPAYEMPNAAAAASSSPADPLSLGMKWQGNNDTPLQTRNQNLDGRAFGSGAEVGMKLHF